MAIGRKPYRNSPPPKFSILSQVLSLNLPPPQECEFKAFSATVVRITKRDGGSLGQLESGKSMEMRFEDGRWRIDSGGIEDFHDLSRIPPKR
jgi:hypothetical protein